MRHKTINLIYCSKYQLEQFLFGHWNDTQAVSMALMYLIKRVHPTAYQSPRSLWPEFKERDFVKSHSIEEVLNGLIQHLASCQNEMNSIWCSRLWLLLYFTGLAHFISCGIIQRRVHHITPVNKTKNDICTFRFTWR